MINGSNRILKNKTFREAVKEYYNKCSVKIEYEDEETYISDVEVFPSLENALERVLFLKDAFKGAEIEIFQNHKLIDISDYML